MKKIKLAIITIASIIMVAYGLIISATAVFLDDPNGAPTYIDWENGGT